MAPAGRGLLRQPHRRAFLLRKLHSLSGLIPLGFFLGFHLWVNAAAIAGPVVYGRAVQAIEHLPALGALEVLFVFVPLAFHGFVGLALAVQGSPSLGRYPYSAHWWYVLQRLTGVVVMAFVIWHLSEYRIPKLFGRISSQAFHPMLVARLSWTAFGIPWIAFAYVIGVTACVVHLANGLAGFCTSWGVVISRRGRRIAAIVAGAVGLALLLLGLATTFHLATGAFGLDRTNW